MRKPVLAICEQQRRRSACASALSDQHLCCSLLGWNNTSTCNIQKFKTLASFWSWESRFESTLVKNPEDRFSRDVAQLLSSIAKYNLILFLRLFKNSVCIFICTLSLIVQTVLLLQFPSERHSIWASCSSYPSLQATDTDDWPYVVTIPVKFIWPCAILKLDPQSVKTTKNLHFW